MGTVITAMVMSMVVRQQLRPSIKFQNHMDLVALKELVEAGKVIPVVGGTYPLSETPDAMGHVGAGHARGTVVISMAAPTVAALPPSTTAAPVGGSA